MHRTPTVDFSSLPREERIRRYRVAAKIMRAFAAKIPVRAEHYLLRALEFEACAEEEEKCVDNL